ncbi:MAG: histidine phosphatase family protein [Alphaproteobacteria bacterium]|nr:histidine phosphatase family protein [Alphaproteobacteria bacterium]
MSQTNFWLIRHALVEENARAYNYGATDVELCPHTLESARPTYAALARRLPQPAVWVISPLSRTRRTAAAIFRDGYPEQPLAVEPAVIEQSMGDWHGLPHADVPGRLTMPAHPFWPLAGQERPPGGESMADVMLRVGPALERLATAHAGRDVVVVSHGGTIRAAIGHALGVGPDAALHFSVHNLALTRLERHPRGWSVVCANEIAGA